MRAVNVPVGFSKLGQGPPSIPKAPAATVTKLRADVDRAILEIENSLEDVRVYASLLSTNVLRADPTAYQAIPDIAMDFTPDELRTIVHDDAKVLGSIADRLWHGATGAYITGDQARLLERLVAKARGIMVAIEAGGPLPSVSDLDLARDHQDQVAGKAGDLLAEAEMAVVSAEAGSVPVLEPYEKDAQTLKTIAGAGIAAAILWGLWSLLS
jgi:hypothetical protein